MTFATSAVLKQHWLPNGRLSTRTVKNHLKSAGLKSRRIIKCPLLADRHQRSRLAWCLARHGWHFIQKNNNNNNEKEEFSQSLQVVFSIVDRSQFEI